MFKKGPSAGTHSEDSSLYLGSLEGDMKKERVKALQSEAAKVMPILQARLGKDARYIQGLRMDVLSYDVSKIGNLYECFCQIDARAEIGADESTARRSSVKFDATKVVPAKGRKKNEVMFSAEELVDQILQQDVFQELLERAKASERRDNGAMTSFMEAIESRMEEMLPILREGLGEDATLLEGIELDVRDLEFEYADNEKQNNSVYYNIDVYLDLGGDKRKFTLASEKAVSQDSFGPSLTPQELAQDLLASQELHEAVREAKRTDRTEERLAVREEKRLLKEQEAFEKNLSKNVTKALAEKLPDSSFLKSVEFDSKATDVSYDPGSGQWLAQIYPTVTLQKDGQVRFYGRGASNIVVQKVGAASEISITPDDIADAILDSPDLRLGRSIALLETEQFMEKDEEVVRIKTKLSKGKEKLAQWYKLWKKSRDTGEKEIAVNHRIDELRQFAGELKDEAKGLSKKKANEIGENVYLAEAISNLEEEVDIFDDEVAIA